jgi:predicted  nucleic acid-binding Zn-ribbon protein
MRGIETYEREGKEPAKKLHASCEADLAASQERVKELETNARSVAKAHADEVRGLREEVARLQEQAKTVGAMGFAPKERT